MKPLIGISPTPSHDEMPHGVFYRYCLSRTYVDSVRAAGGVPVILPTSFEDVDDILPRLDGIILSGGGDLDPATYGEASVHDATSGIDSERDDFELRAFRHAVELDLPTLCICRGIQTMAVAMGGTLVQDIPSELSTQIEHRQMLIGKMRDDLSHFVDITPGNPLHAISGKTRMQVNSFHHQAVRDPGPALAVTATADDGVIEGLWHPGMRFGLGVQWHPEMLADTYPDHAALFNGLVEAARSGVLA